MPSPQKRRASTMSGEVILDVKALNTTYRIKRGRKTYPLKAVDDISFELIAGEILGFVGETGCGKTTVGRSIVGLTRCESGSVAYRGQNILTLGRRQMRPVLLNIRMIFQDPYGSLNPRRSIADSVGETGDIHKVFKSSDDRARQISEALNSVGLDPSFAHRFPHELSGGQRQRVGIARAILPTPDIIIADEPVSALDVSIQVQVLNLLLELKNRLNLTILFISHDLSVVGQISDRIVVMYLGQIVEMADAEQLYQTPLHPYTKALIEAIPIPDPNVKIIKGLSAGEPTSRLDPPPGCSYANRCPLVSDICKTTPPLLKELGSGRHAACHALSHSA